MSPELYLGKWLTNYKKKKIKHKEKVLKEAREEKYLTYRGTKIRITLEFSLETTSKKRVEWNI